MPIYDSGEQFYGCAQNLFQQIEASDAAAVRKMLKSGLLIRFRCSDPTAMLVIDARREPLQVYYGQSLGRPDLDIELTTDTLHAILLGNLSLRKALGRRQLVVKGPVHKTMSLAPLFAQARQLYPAILEECH